MAKFNLKICDEIYQPLKLGLPIFTGIIISSRSAAVAKDNQYFIHHSVVESIEIGRWIGTVGEWEHALLSHEVDEISNFPGTIVPGGYAFFDEANKGRSQHRKFATKAPQNSRRQSESI